MSVFNKEGPPAYAFIPDEAGSEDSDDREDLLHHGPRSLRRPRGILARVRLSFLTCSLGLALYSALLIAATSLWWRREMLHGPGIIHSPLRPYIEYEAKKFPKMNVDHYMVMGPPSEERDAVWADLTQFFFTEFPAEEQARLGRLDEGVRLPNGNYVALYTVNHLLHCLKRLHHSRYPEYYYPNRTDEEKWKEDKHDMHCLEDLVQQVTCHADTAPYTSRWYAKDPRPTGNSDIAHECVNWDKLRAELKRNHVDPWVPGTFVHPIFGPVVTDGKDTVFPDRMSFPNEFEHITGDGSVTYDQEFPGQESDRGEYKIPQES